MLEDYLIEESDLEERFNLRAVTLRYENLPYAKVGKRRYYLVADIVEWFKQRRITIEQEDRPKGSPNWVKGMPSPNPKGGPRKKSLDEIYDEEMEE